LVGRGVTNKTYLIEIDMMMMVVVVVVVVVLVVVVVVRGYGDGILMVLA
jgi:hypothetical protein